jgi:transposase-like protein
MKNTEITCPHCGNGEHIMKNGHYNGMQRYIYSKCKKTFTLSDEDKRIKHPLQLRNLVLTFYLCGTSMRGIQKALSAVFGKKIHFNSVSGWIKNANNILEQEQKRRKEEIPKTGGEKTIIPIVEMDELYTYVKKNPKIKMGNPIMTNEYGLLWIGSEMKLLHLR